MCVCVGLCQRIALLSRINLAEIKRELINIEMLFFLLLSVCARGFNFGHVYLVKTNITGSSIYCWYYVSGVRRQRRRLFIGGGGGGGGDCGAAAATAWSHFIHPHQHIQKTHTYTEIVHGIYTRIC